MTEAGGHDRGFTVEDVSVLTYLGMARLAPRATFADALQEVVDVAETYFGGRLDRKDKVDAVRVACDRVGVKRWPGGLRDQGPTPSARLMRLVIERLSRRGLDHRGWASD